MQVRDFLLPPNRFPLLPSPPPPPPSPVPIPTQSTPPTPSIRCTQKHSTSPETLTPSISDADLAARGIRVRRSSAGLDLEALNAVFARAGFPRREAARIRAALEHTDAMVWLEEDGAEGAPVAFARATGDGVFNAVVWDVAVEPALQGTGLGKAVMERLLGDLRDRGIGNIALYAEPKVVGFYRMLGFAADPDGIKAMVYSRRRSKR